MIKKKYLTEFINTIQKYNLFLKNQDILISYSGGQDSMLTLYTLWKLRRFYNFKLNTVWFNHFWQKDNFKIFPYIFNVSKILNTRLFIVFPIQISKSENQARNWRKYNLYRLQQFYNLDLIVEGHTKSDKVETFLFNLFRGTGIKGLITLKWKQIFKKDIINSNAHYFASYKNLLKE